MKKLLDYVLRYFVLFLLLPLILVNWFAMTAVSFDEKIEQVTDRWIDIMLEKARVTINKITGVED